ncbi:MAG: alpha-1,4-glucan--maltose-1-phosphate maltosyltransferase [Chlorobium sp.]|jgi:starch synthase (maltosyl-transferring)|nr:alpha-1,4-glucan--maltose-1-phosphate maltosyltransferase [Chlorobium sp.]
MNNSFQHTYPQFGNYKFDGRQRVVIENVSPELDGGKYPAKGVENGRVAVEADIFVDGADTITAGICCRAAGSIEWERSPMESMGNDRWKGSFRVGLPGAYEYTIEAQVDHFQTWKKGLIKKIDADQNVSLDLRIGALLVEKGAARANKADAQKLTRFVTQLCVDNTVKATTAALDEQLSILMDRNPDTTCRTTYDKVLSLTVEQKKAGCSAWYEFFPRSWASEPGKHGTFNDCLRLLPMVAGMGFDVIYLPPIHPIGYTKRKGKNNALVAAPDEPGSCWAIGNSDGGHKAVHPELGTIEDFAAFVTAAEEAGISVALDIAFQCSPDHPYVQEHPQWFTWRPDGTVQFAENPPKRYEDILPINFESDDWKNLWIELKSIFLFWISKGVKIFRVDNPHTKAFPFWEWAIASIRAEHPETVFLAEAFTRPKLMARLAKIGYSQSYSYFTWRNTKDELQEYVTELTSSPLKHFMRANFWPNTPDILHEELQKGEREKFIIRLVLASTLSANYGMYGPAYELCEHLPVAEGKEEYLNSEKYEIRQWDLDRPGNIRAEITRINRIRKENSALQQTSNITFVRIESSPGNEHDKLMAYVKQSDEGSNIILTVVNLDPSRTQSGWLRFPLELFGLSHLHQFNVEDLLTGNHYQWNGEWNFVEINPRAMPAHIFRVTLD